jgi:hypothetical protein
MVGKEIVDRLQEISVKRRVDHEYMAKDRKQNQKIADN